MALFDRPNPPSDLKRLACNHDILPTIDAANQRASLLAGYGLEALVIKKRLNEAPASGTAAFPSEDFFRGCRQVINQTIRNRAQIASTSDATDGISTKQLFSSESN